MEKYRKKQTIYAYTLAFLILIISSLMSYKLKDWQWFGRSGSLVVILGIILTSNQIIENSRRLKQQYQGAHKVGNFQKDWAMNKRTEILQHTREHENGIWIIGKCGFNLLIIGTFIWGFGDLIGYLN